MEAAILGALIKAAVPKLLALAGEEYKLQTGVKKDVEFLRNELLLVTAQINSEPPSVQGGDLSELLIEDLRKLAFGIEDYVDSLRYYTIWKQQLASWSKIARLPKMLGARLQFAREGQRLKNLVADVQGRRTRFAGSAQQQPSAAAAARMDESSSPAFDPRNVRGTHLVGIDGLRAELLEQLAPGAAPGKLEVIAIVGFCGLGKTALAAHVYNTEIDNGRFEKHAWVSAAGKQPTAVLTAVLNKLADDSAGSSQLCQDIREQLHNKRYLIVVDDIETEDLWKEIKTAFPDDNGVSSRIVVTTTIKSVAKACRSSKSYVHKMRRLDEKYSKQLFLKACPDQYEQPCSATILEKCDGQPLALVTIGEFLQTREWLKKSSCGNIWKDLQYYLERSPFKAMRRGLIRNYTSLPDHALKACLLYFGMFPSDYQIKRKRLLRLWLAEGFLELESSTSTPDPIIAFDELEDRNIIEPIDVSNNGNVKTCQTYGMMHEYILNMSTSQKFVTLLCDMVTNDKYVRRLSLQKSAAANVNNSDIKALSLVRSLMVFRKPSEAILDFSKFFLLRVLDLEKYDDLEDEYVENICSLLLLKYLSLGKKVTKLPKNISKLTVLETLDLRGSSVTELLPEVFQMPCLLHLFGKFTLPNSVYFSKQGSLALQTLAGFVAEGRQGYFNFMNYMKKLRKVKVWCKSSADAGGTDLTDLQKAIQKFIQNGGEENIGDRSLSLFHFDKSFIDSLHSPKKHCYLSSLKLYSELDALPKIVTSLQGGLKELCLSSVKFRRDLLEALTQLSNLTCLKLIADDLEKFTIKKEAFPRLLHLCFILKNKNPTFPTIEKGSMPFLNTLHLLCKDRCKDLHDLCDIKMEYLKDLKKVILDGRVDLVTCGKWEEPAKEDPNKPKVFLSKTYETSKKEPIAEISKRKPSEDSVALVPARIGFTRNSVESMGSLQDTGSSMVVKQGNAVASMGSVQDMGGGIIVDEGLESSAEPKTHNSCAVQASLDGGSNSSSNHTNLSETASKAESELMDDSTVLLEPTKVDSANNSVSLDETIEHNYTQISVNQNLGSSDDPKRQISSASADIENHAFKGMGVSGDPISTELSITGHGMVPSHTTLQEC